MNNFTNLYPKQFLTKEEETKLFNEYYSTPSNRIKKQIKDKIVLNQTPSVVSIAKNYRDSDCIYDLVQEGMIAVLIAFNNYDPKSDASFTTFCRPAINGHLIRYLQKNKTIKLPDRAPKLIKQINKAKELLHRLQQPETTTEIAKITGIKEQKIIDILNGIKQAELNAINNEGEELINSIKDHAAEEAFDKVLDTEEFKEYELDLSFLPNRQRQIIEMYYYQQLEISEIAEILNIKSTNVSRQKVSALNNLREQLGNKLWTH